MCKNIIQENDDVCWKTRTGATQRSKSVDSVADVQAAYGGMQIILEAAIALTKTHDLHHILSLNHMDRIICGIVLGHTQIYLINATQGLSLLFMSFEERRWCR